MRQSATRATFSVFEKNPPLSLLNRAKFSNSESGLPRPRRAAWFAIGLTAAQLLSTACAPRLEIRSTPEGATVRAVLRGQSNLVDLGKTPLRLSERQLDEIADSGGAGSGACPLLVIERDGFKPEKVRLPASRWLRESNVMPIRLQAIPSTSPEQTPTLSAVTLYFQAQEFAASGAVERALVLLDRALSQDASFARAMSLKGGIFARQGRTAESVLWFERALAADPTMEDVQASLASLRGKSDAAQVPPKQ